MLFCSGKEDDLIWANKRFFFLIRFIDNLVLQLCPSKLRICGGEWPKRLAASVISLIQDS